MHLVSSIILEDNVQVDGRFSVKEFHTDNLGGTYMFDYVADSDANITDVMAVHAAQLNEQLALRLNNNPPETN